VTLAVTENSPQHMNQVITEGLQLKPPVFAEGLAQWSREDGRPNQDTYANRRVLRNGQLTARCDTP